MLIDQQPAKAAAAYRPTPTTETGRLRHLTVRSAVRQYALEYAAARRKLSTGKPRFTRITGNCLEQLEAQFKAAIRARVDRLPSNGRTIT